MTRGGSIFFTLALVAVIAFVTCFFSNEIWHRMNGQGYALQGDQPLHYELQLTRAQEKQLEPIEQRFMKRKTELEIKIQQANAELGQALMSENAYSDKVKTAVDKIHVAMGELQKATLEHLFEMQAVLTPEQSAKLKRLAADALIHNQ